MASAHLGRSPAFERGVAGFGDHCIDQNECDHVVLAAAIKSGRVAARTGIRPEAARTGV
jgi:hypothetical protein